MKTEYRKAHFFLTPNKIFDEGLKPREFIVYSYLLRCGDAKSNRFLQEKTLQKNVQYQFPQLTLHLKILKRVD